MGKVIHPTGIFWIHQGHEPDVESQTTKKNLAALTILGDKSVSPLGPR